MPRKRTEPREAHSYRIAPHIYAAAKAKSERKGVSLSSVISRLLAAYAGVPDNGDTREDHGKPQTAAQREAMAARS